jgi:hypothetical protein
MSWKVEVVDGRPEGHDDGMKTTHSTGYRFGVNGTVGRHKTVGKIWFSQ